MAPLKVLYICHNHPITRPGGAEQYALELHRAMRDRDDVDPTFVAKGGPPAGLTGTSHRGTCFAPVGTNESEYFVYTDEYEFDWVFGTISGKDFYTRHFARFLKAFQPDVVHFQHTLFLGFDLIRQVRNSLPDAAILYTLHEFLPICRNQGQMVRTFDGDPCLHASPRRCNECFPDITPQTFFLRQRFAQSHFELVDLFLAPSHFLLERYVEWGIPRSRIRFEDYGRLPALSAAPVADRAVRDHFGYFGQLSPFKGVLVLLEAIRLLHERSPDAHLWVHGANLELHDEPFRRAFKDLIDHPAVTFVGKYDHGELPALMEQIDWVVVPSVWWENSPLVIQEAFSHQRPVICSDIGGMAEKVDDGVNGLHFRVGSPDSLAARMASAVDDPELWEKLRAGIPSVYPMSTHADELIDVYRSLVSARKGEAAAMIDHAAYLSDRWLLVSGWFLGGDDGQARARILVGGLPFEVPNVTVLNYERADVSHLGPLAGRFCLVATPEGSGPVEALQLVDGRGDELASVNDVPTITTDVRTLLLRGGGAALRAQERSELLRFLLGTLDAGPSPTALDHRLSASLSSARELLRERLQESQMTPELPAILTVDIIVAVDPWTFWVEGWLRVAASAGILRLTAVSPEGERVEMLENLFRHRRPDVEEFLGVGGPPLGDGFLATVRLPRPSVSAQGWVFELVASNLEACEATAPGVRGDAEFAKSHLSARLAWERPFEDGLRRHHIGPAMTRLLEQHRGKVSIATVEQFGTPPDGCDVSIIVPLYRHLEFIEYQLAQFVNDPDLGAADLIYVLDSPEAADGFRSYARQLHELYGLAFRVVVLTANSGFAHANNLGATVASGRLLLLLNSDVLPEAAGWLRTMVDFHDSTPGIGALGSMLLYEDDSIQHGGLYFERLDGELLWRNEHHYKGLHRTFPAANVARPVPAVTGACMMIEAELYRRFGGLRGSFIQGDYEDSDLCLRLLEAGYQNWYQPAAVLYHLEGQSYPSESRALNGLYNQWLQTAEWGERIEGLTGVAPEAPAPRRTQRRRSNNARAVNPATEV